VVYAGGWTDYRTQRGGDFIEAKEASKPLAKKEKPVEKKVSSGLSFTEKHRLEELPAVMDKLTAEIAKLEELLADPALFTQNPVKFQKATDALVARQTALSDAEEEWLMLEEKAGA
jgi:ATP-binding cassette subfamily F protein uup